MKTAIENTHFNTRRHCPLCGGSTWKTAYAVSLLYDDGEKAADHICEGCMEDAPEGAALRMRVRAERLREQADWLDATAPEVAAIALGEWFTVEEAQAFSKEQWRLFEQEEAVAIVEAMTPEERAAAMRPRENDIPF